ncbi:unnamed protein product [Didymodactylos carnosus]|uniref:Uncharacterized protein n=1 Tax=Didymodactylos carnosus TaxID=1234261 RepID=A0A8S2E2I2_9BILA|nr:unnamed protein product [Didymodactylos carnosus]CAF3886928.1 unnamed protein product [Didymodactylos carnosus]
MTLSAPISQPPVSYVDTVDGMPYLRPPPHFLTASQTVKTEPSPFRQPYPVAPPLRQLPPPPAFLPPQPVPPPQRYQPHQQPFPTHQPSELFLDSLANNLSDGVYDQFKTILSRTGSNGMLAQNVQSSSSNDRIPFLGEDSEYEEEDYDM